MRTAPVPGENPPVETDDSAPPATIAGWKARSHGLLSDPCCAFHRNVEISARYAGCYRHMPGTFKWTAMAAIASHHVRRALFPLKLDTDRMGFLDVERSLKRRKLLHTSDVHTIRETNNAIFDDIFWAHLAYDSPGCGIEGLRTLVHEEPGAAPLLAGFETIDRGRREGDDELVWAGNVQLLEHEQRSMVQPRFDRLSCAYARILSIGSATSFEVHGMRREFVYFTSFYLYSMTRGAPDAMRARTWPRITRFEDRWRWLVGSVVPHFQKFDREQLVNVSLERILHDASIAATMPCRPE
jgi:hypothetical protein